MDHKLHVKSQLPHTKKAKGSAAQCAPAQATGECWEELRTSHALESRREDSGNVLRKVKKKREKKSQKEKEIAPSGWT